MRIIDAHVHLVEPVDIETARTWLDDSPLEACHLFSSDPAGAADGGRAAIENLAEVARELPERVRPLAWIDPLHADATRLAEWALRDCGMAGLKMIPRGWYPDDGRAKAVYRVAGELGAPIQFHSGVLWLGADTSRYCRPAGFEVMFEFPNVRFSLAHIGWPWTDECIAVVQKFKVMNARDASRDSHQAFVDLTVGTPLIYRRDALEKCLSCIGADYMMFGTDGVIPREPFDKEKLQTDLRLLGELNVSPGDREKIFAANAERFLRRR